MMCIVLDFGKNVHAFIKVMHGEQSKPWTQIFADACKNNTYVQPQEGTNLNICTLCKCKWNLYVTLGLILRYIYY